MLRPTDCNSRLGSECEVSALRFCTYFFAEGVNEITLRPRHASPISTHIVETDHPLWKCHQAPAGDLERALNRARPL